MNKNSKGKLIGGLGLIAAVFVLSGCTANFCNDFDRASIAYPYDQGVTVYCDQADIPDEYQADGLNFKPIAGNDQVYAYIPVDSDGYFAAEKATYLTGTIISGAVSKYYTIPGYDYYKALDQKVLDYILSEWGGDVTTITAADLNPFSEPDCDSTDSGATINSDSILRNYGYLKFYGGYNGTELALWNNYDQWHAELLTELEPSICPNDDFLAYYKSAMNTKVSNIRTCLTTTENNYGHYGNSSNWSVKINATTWGEAWKKGFLEGLIEYPVVWLLDTMSYSFDPALTGAGQVGALILVTLIVRFLLMAIMFKGTMDQQKMQLLQPQIAKIQAKYPNSNTNQAEKQRLSQETAMLYKRNKVNMFTPFLMMIVQFPVFIAVWGALSGSAVLSSGSVLNLRLSDSIQSVLTNFSGAWYNNSTGWWTALVLFILMAGLQLVAMLLPNWITKARTKKQAKLSANPAQDKNRGTQRTMMIVMFVITVIMGFALPAAMGIYWAIGAVVSMIQTLITQYILSRRQKKEGR